MQGLAQVVAGGCQKTRFVLAGLLSGFLRLAGVVGLGAQLHHQPLVVKFEQDAVARRLCQVARMQAGQGVIGHHHHHSRQSDRRWREQQRGQRAADGAAEVGDVGAVHRRSQPQRPRGDCTQNANVVNHPVDAVAELPDQQPQAAPEQAHRRHADGEPPGVLVRGFVRARQGPQGQINGHHHQQMHPQPPQHDVPRHHQRQH